MALITKQQNFIDHYFKAVRCIVWPAGRTANQMHLLAQFRDEWICYLLYC